jgi:hypothetical protein
MCGQWTLKLLVIEYGVCVYVCVKVDSQVVSDSKSAHLLCGHSFTHRVWCCGCHSWGLALV